MGLEVHSVVPSFFLVRCLVQWEQVSGGKILKTWTQLSSPSSIPCIGGLDGAEQWTLLCFTGCFYADESSSIWDPGILHALSSTSSFGMYSENGNMPQVKPLPQLWTQSYQEVIPNLRCLLYLNQQVICILYCTLDYSCVLMHLEPISVFTCLKPG